MNAYGSAHEDPAAGASSDTAFINGTGETETGSGAPGTYSQSGSSEETRHAWVWLSVIFLMLALTPIIIWAIRKSDQGQDGSDEVLFQKLDTQKIIGKISNR